MKNLVFLLLLFVSAQSQTWVSRARLVDHVGFYTRLVQEVVYELENQEWCNLKLVDITQSIDDMLYNFRMTANVTYTNGFVVSIQKIEVDNIEQLFTTQTINGVATPTATVRGRLNFRDMKIGYDVIANLEGEGEHRFTGTFLHSLVQIQTDINMNVLTKEFTSSPVQLSVSAGTGVRMAYMPSNRVTEALSRRFSSSTFDSAVNWGNNIITPLMVDLTRTKVNFPDICFSNCS